MGREREECERGGEREIEGVWERRGERKRGERGGEKEGEE